MDERVEVILVDGIVFMFCVQASDVIDDMFVERLSQCLVRTSVILNDVILSSL